MSSYWTVIVEFIERFILQIFPIIAALFTTNSAPAFAFFKFMQVSCYVDKMHRQKTLAYILFTYGTEPSWISWRFYWNIAIALQ